MKKVHRCARYLNARGEVIDPAKQGGIGCKVCRSSLEMVQRRCLEGPVRSGL